MRQPVTVSERVLQIAWVLVTTAWCLFALWVILSYQGSSPRSTWIARLVMMLIAAGVTAGVVLAVRSFWRRALARPLPGGRVNGWIVCRPGWQLALLYWCCLGLPSLVANLVAANSGHHAQSAGVLGIMLASSVTGASFLALTLRVAWRRQAQNVRPPSAGSQEE